MTRSKLDVTRWLLGLEVIVCLGPLTVLWTIAMYMVVAGGASATSIVVPTLLGTIGPIGLLLGLGAIVLRRSIASTSFSILALCFAALAIVQIATSGTPWFTFDWRVWMLNSVLPCIACAHLGLIGFSKEQNSLG